MCVVAMPQGGHPETVETDRQPDCAGAGRRRTRVGTARRAVRHGRFGGTALSAALLAAVLLAAPIRAEEPPAPVEVTPASQVPCFPGAYYRKAVSSFDRWQGIEGVVTLPEVEFDKMRMRPNGRYMDNASVYLGGHAAETEIDAGVSWEVVREPDGTVSKQGKAFRPFWRNVRWSSGPANPAQYYYPGDTIRMRCETREPGKLRMQWDLLARKATGTTTSLCNADALTTFATDFDAPGFGPDSVQQFKRVNAIDQSGNEGKSVQPTSATVTRAVWHAVWLLRDGQRLPMTTLRFTDMRCPSPEHVKVEFRVDTESAGSESVSLYGTPPVAGRRDPAGK